MDIDVLNGKLSKLEEKIIITIFSIVIILGIFGNLLVIWTVLFNKQMRTSNNVIIINLAISDLILCFFSIPFNVYKTLRHTWMFGDFLCRLTPFFQASNVFVSSMSITAIALDRYIHIVCAVRLRQSSGKSSQLRTYFSMTICALIWIFAFLLSSPLFYYNTTTHLSVIYNESGALDTLPNIDMISESLLPFTTNVINQNKKNNDLVETTKFQMIITKPPSTTTISTTVVNLNETDLSLLDNLEISIFHCVENWNNHKSRMIYSYSSLMIQYILPILIVGAAYGSIWWKLETHRSRLRKHTENFTVNDYGTKLQHNNQQQNEKLTKQEFKPNNLNMNEMHTHTSMTSKKPSSLNNEHKKRRRKMNILLMSISIIFAVSWLPLNIFNIMSDLKLSIIKADHTYFLINAICILVGMSSAVSNPCLYGVFNENFRREYSRLFNKLFNKFYFNKASLDDAEAIEILNRKIQYSIKSNDKCNNNNNQNHINQKITEQNKLIAPNNSNSIAVNNKENNQNTTYNLKEEILNEMQ